MRMIKILSKNCNPLREAIPMYRKTPKRTGIGMWPNRGVRNTDMPIVKKMRMWVTLCSLTPKNWGFSPGAEHSLSSFRELTWLMERTVAATNHGRPMMEQIWIKMARMKRSKW
jgi:hypothetical protein